MNTQKGLSVKDLVTTGIFTALMIVFTMLGGMFFAPNPVLTFYMPMGCALLCGPVYLLLVAKVHKRWSITILGIILGFVFFVPECIGRWPSAISEWALSPTSLQGSAPIPIKNSMHFRICCLCFQTPSPISSFLSTGTAGYTR